MMSKQRPIKEREKNGLSKTGQIGNFKICQPVRSLLRPRYLPVGADELPDLCK